MCESCGCSQPDPKLAHDHDHDGPDDQRQARMVEVRRDVLAHNSSHAKGNRDRLKELQILAINLISSPGSGKTTLLEKTIGMLNEDFQVMVIEGDLQTDRDAARIRATGAAAHQINTGEGCHLDAHMVGHAMDHLPLSDRGILFIENVGNLVCPASFDLGEAHKVALLSVAEGDDKVVKYPVAFRDASALVVNKIDLLEHVDFSLEECRKAAKLVNPQIEIFEVSARTGQGLESWCEWIRAQTNPGA